MTSTPTADKQAEGGDIYRSGQIYSKPPRKTIRLREDGWRKACLDKGVASDTVLGSLLRYNPSHVYRVRLGLATPGARFIATAMDVFELEFGDLFEIVEEDESAADEDEGERS